MKKWVPSDKRERLVLSNYQWGMLQWFWNCGHFRTCEIDAGLLTAAGGFKLKSDGAGTYRAI